MLQINKLYSHSAVDYAAEELKKYLRMMMPEGGDVKIAYNPEARDGFRLGLMQDFGLDVSDAEDTELDDIIYIDTDERDGIIAGSNPRSVLLAVYEYFRQMGCRWLFPGVDGEYIPMKDITTVKYRHKADSRVRGNCLEGYPSQKVLLDFIEFMPKVGLNAFMIQFKIPKIYYDRAYGYLNDYLEIPTEYISLDQAQKWTTLLECEIEKRGIFLHSCGHGFTVDPFGIDSAGGWSKADSSNFSEDIMKYYAMKDGVRKFHKDQPMNTQLCMTNREARKKVADYIVEYSKKHPNINYLHTWLADDYNNHCECEECKKHRPSDLYVKLMNEVDEALTAAKLDTKIVVIVYVDTFWAPVAEKLRECDRFVLMVAPIMRDYTRGYDENEELPALRPYERNKLKLPETFEENVAYYNEWKKNFKGDHFVFEYHFWKHQHFDLSGRMLARRIFDDIKAYRALGESGILQCGAVSSFFPNGYAFYTHARALFDASLTLDEIDRDYHSHAYGDAAGEITEALEELSEAFPYECVSPLNVERREGWYAAADVPERIARAREIRERLLEIVKKNYNSDLRYRTVSIRILEYYCTYMEKFLNIFEMLAKSDKDGADAALRDFKIWPRNAEAYLANCYDHGQASEIIGYRIIRIYNNGEK